MLAAARHGYVVETYGLIEHDGVCALALQYLPGGDLVSLAGVDPRHWLRAAYAVHAALTHLHSLGYAHRDVKARNVLFDARGRARLIDFASALPLGAPAAIRRHHGRTPAVWTQPDCHGRGRRLCVRGSAVRAHCRPAAVRSRGPAARVAQAPRASRRAQEPHGGAGRASPRRARSRSQACARTFSLCGCLRICHSGRPRAGRDLIQATSVERQWSRAKHNTKRP